METTDVAAVLEHAHNCIRSSRLAVGRLRTGVDLGTATCVITVIDDDDQPVWIDFDRTAAVRDGVVVDFAAAVTAVRQLKARAEEELGHELLSGATAFPPCIGEADSRACRFVLEGAGFEDVVLVDEVTAANKTLGIKDGVVVDVGGGSTGVGVLRDGELVALDDRAGGGHHLDLVLAGALGIELAEAEKRKRAGNHDYLAILRPGIERIASSIRDLTSGADELDVHLAGGALMLPGADAVISKFLGREVRSYPHALLITPLGIARYAS
ncbi:ethanolamine utilization protein EutJ [Rhodococcus sp. IEGM 1366]|uniref:ethanolamine utilization protein EutJ n=1 Tax=Rhodococcus sp. IEGM 1366 TaxID=3082223 RepID=UPI002953DD7A|nr:ethanolamine utilization protein EutJ [Rhodococcus sp. IEGM 1366]MDV8070725.1 ethanolamine utilization protein EutJ [Rhodococcus sp. IEGM 1366]